jgi:Gas vesicle synthesis protein GvpL/GvpF
VLAYCVGEQQTKFSSLGTGVGGAAVRWIDVGRLRCFVSDFAAQMPYAPVPEMVKAFNQVLQRIFAQAVIIPFRFPTIVESEGTLRQFVESREAEYGGALKRLRNKVQMDVRIISKARESVSSSSTRSGRAQSERGQSGRGYLEGRRERYQQAQSVMDEFRRVSNSLAEEWIQRDTPSGIRSFALVDRSSLAVFLERIGSVVTPADISARITGPWPPSEFVEITRE